MANSQRVFPSHIVPVLETQQSRKLPDDPKWPQDASRYSFPSSPVANPKSIVQGSQYRFTVLTDRLIRYEWSDDGGFEDRVSTVAFFRNFDVPEFRVVDKSGSLEITTSYFHLSYDKKRFSTEGLAVRAGDDVWHYDGKSFGDLGGTARTLDGADGRVPLTPGILSRKNYSVLDDTDSMLFENGWIAVRKPGRLDGYLFAYHGDHKAAIKAYFHLSGNQPMLPRWALGNWWSRYWEYTSTEYLGLMDRFQKEDIPMNVGIIDMDWHLVNIPSRFGSGWTGYTWNRDLWPNPEAALEELHKKNLKVALNDHPADGIRAFEDQYHEVAAALGHDTSKEAPVVFDCTDKKFMDVFFDVLKLNLEKQGLDFWWLDWQQGTGSKIPGVDPLWVLNHSHYLTSQRNVPTIAKRMTFSRYAGPGAHRYPIGFSGDTVISWRSLDFQPEFTATASNIGYGWWSHDIGGHFHGERSNEMMARWVQLGCFSPILRLHSTKSQWNSKEPWLYSPAAFAVIKRFMILRHRLIPYLYTMNVRACYDNEPLIQPMYWNHPDIEAAYSVPNQYYFGPDLVVSPVTTPDSKQTSLGAVRTWLPKGRWIDILHPTLVYDGNRHVRLHRSLSEIPVLAKEGTIVPLDAASKLQNGSPQPKDVLILLVVGEDAHFELIEESESSSSSPLNNPPANTFARTPISWNQKTGVLTIGPEVNGSGAARNWSVCLVGHTSSNVQAQVPGFKVTKSESSTHVALGDVTRFAAMRKKKPFEISLGEDLQLDTVDIPTRVREVVFKAEIPYVRKDDLWWDAVQNSGEAMDRRLASLRGRDVDQSVKDAVVEIWASDSRAPGNAVAVVGSLDAEVEVQEEGYVVVEKENGKEVADGGVGEDLKAFSWI